MYFPNSLKEVHSYLKLLGKEEGEAEGWGKREFPGSLLSRLILPEAVLEHCKQGVTCTLGPRKPLKEA
jgi:hypothetical protein